VLVRLPQYNPERRWGQDIEYEPGETPELGLELYEDDSRSIITANESPDLSFRFNLTPYRGCAHGCAYCYARQTHEYLGFGIGADFERKLVVKRRAPELLRETFESERWRGDLLVISGNTDAYQPIEAQLGLTRACLEVCAEYANPVHIITKGCLVERDLDVLQRLQRRTSVGVSISVTFWDADVARAIEPYAPPPRRRVETIRRLSAAGVPVMLHVAPVIPGLSDRDVVPIMEASRQAGAVSAMMMPVRLPGGVAEVFEQRLAERLPLKHDKVIARIREMRGGRLNESRFFLRQKGQGQYSRTLEQMFEATSRRLGFGPFPEPRTDTFTRPPRAGDQLALFRS
jgi:DNA repair photolyase